MDYDKFLVELKAKIDTALKNKEVVKQKLWYAERTNTNTEDISKLRGQLQYWQGVYNSLRETEDLYSRQ